MNKKGKVSIIVPCYNEEAVLVNFYQEVMIILKDKMHLKDFEVLFIDDGSKDQTSNIMKRLAIEDEHVEFLSFSRNFGKESAMYAGLQYADGEYSVIMDADLQHPPCYIMDMYELIRTKKYDMIASRRKKRGNEARLRSFCSESFYKIMNKISGIDMGNNAMDFRMFNEKAKNAILSMTEYNRFSKGIFEWIGFKTYWLEVDIAERIAGESKWSFKKLFAYSLEGCVAFSTLPLSISSLFGFIFFLIALIMIIIMIIQSYINGISGNGFATIICTILMVGGIQLFCMGILGQYLAKAYLESKNRPLFLVQDTSVPDRGNR
jgi:glycosyltransferase involved in cell wall biosynthesis